MDFEQVVATPTERPPSPKVSRTLTGQSGPKPSLLLNDSEEIARQFTINEFELFQSVMVYKKTVD